MTHRHRGAAGRTKPASGPILRPCPCAPPTPASVYDAHVRGLPRDVQVQLVAVIADEASLYNEPGTTPRSPKLLDLAGLGAQIWQGVDAGDYVRELREEWDRRP